MRKSSLFLISIAAVAAACGSSSTNGPVVPGDAGGGSGGGSGSSSGSSSGGGSGSSSGSSSGGSADSGPFTGEAPHPALPILVQQGVGVLTAPKIVTVTFPGDTNATQLQTFGATATNNAWWDTVRAGYCDTGSTTSCVGDGPAGTNAALTAAPAASYTDSSQGGPSSLQTFIKTLIPAQIPQPDAQTILVFYFPSTTTVTLDGASSCVQFGGYHNSMSVGGTRFSYAVVNECAPQQGSTRTAQQLITFEASHEIVEAATDPYQVQSATSVSLGYYLDFNDPAVLPWNGLGGGEAGDMCVDFLPFEQDGTTEGGFTVQRIWSNAAAAAGHDPCVPGVSTPYFNVAPENWLLTTTVGASATFTADAFSDAATASWTLVGYDLNATSQTNTNPYLGFTLNGKTSATVNNGDKVTVSVTLKQDPSSLPSYYTNPGGNAFGAIGLLISLNGASPQTATAGHYWPFLVTSTPDALDSGLNTVDAAADMPLRPLPGFKMTREQRANFARVFPNVKWQ